MKSYSLYLKRNFDNDFKAHENFEWKNMVAPKKHNYSPITEFFSLFQKGKKVSLKNNTQVTYYFHASEDFEVMSSKASKLFDYYIFEYFILVEVNFHNFSTSQHGLKQNVHVLKSEIFFDENKSDNELII